MTTKSEAAAAERKVGQGIEPMTAAGYREFLGEPVMSDIGRSILAALEDREAMLADAKQLAPFMDPTFQAHARLGSLVAAIREKRLALRDVSGKGGNFVIGVGEPRIYFLVHDDDGFEEALSHLDSLLPKEPEVAPSGWTYERVDDVVLQIDHEGGTLVVRRADSDAVPPIDRDFVAKILEASRGK